MAYKEPKDVISPKSRLKLISIRNDKGPQDPYNNPDGGWSIAEVLWDNRVALGVRWNGDDSSCGNPQSRGIPTWFILPEELATIIKNNLPADNSNAQNANSMVEE